MSGTGPEEKGDDGEADAERYVVEVKPSARRTNGAVGAAVNRRGSRRRFGGRPAAESWAAALSEEGPLVWIRAANPNDAAAVDGYLVGRRTHSGDGRDRAAEREGTQAALAAYDGEQGGAKRD